MGRDGKVVQRQHFCHDGDTICHPKSGYVTTKLHGTSTCGCNNNAIFSDTSIGQHDVHVNDVDVIRVDLSRSARDLA